MLKDEASLSREKMKTLNLEDLVKNIVEEFNNNPAAIEKNIKFEIIREKLNGKDLQLAGIWNRLEQVFANCFANAVSFSPDNGNILVNITSNKDMILIKIKDEGPGFTEGNTDKIFARFYSNRPKKFGEHSGLGLNIVKSIVEMHEGKIKASNRSDGKNGAEIELQLPRQS
jgi:two-component system sensor histidine kinase ChvG